MRLILLFLIIIAVCGTCHSQPAKQKVLSSDPQLTKSNNTSDSNIMGLRAERIIVVSDTAQYFKIKSLPNENRSNIRSKQVASPAAELKKNYIPANSTRRIIRPRN